MPSHKSLEERRAYHREYMRRRYAADEQFRNRQRARAAVGHALRDGVLTRGACVSCGAANTEGHHDDYAEPLNVKWLCRNCHELRHGGPGCHG